MDSTVIEPAQKSVRLKVEQLPIGAVRPTTRNARTHSAVQVSQIAASIAAHGFNNPLLIDRDGELIAGHGRLMAAAQLGLKTVPCIRLGHLTDAQKRAYMLADNKLALNAGWDDTTLRAELQALSDLNEVDLELTGFSANELENLLATPGIDGEGAGSFVTDSRYLVLVELPDEVAQAKLFTELQDRGLECKLMN